MKKGCKVIAGAFVMIFMVVLPLMAAGEWKEVKNRKGVKVDTRKLENSRLKEFRSQCLIDAPLEVVYEILRDPSTYKSWFASCSEMRTVHTIDDYNFKWYQVVNLPPPFRDRDIVTTFHYDIDWGGGKIILTMGGGDAPKDASYNMYETTKKHKRVRISAVKGVIVLDRIASDKTNMIYQAHADPGLAVPPWLLNLFGVSHPYKSLVGMKKEVKKEEYYKRAEKRHNRKFVMNLQKRN